MFSFRFRHKKAKVENYVHDVVPRYNPDDFRRFFRMRRHTFEVICQQLAGVLPEYQTLRSSGRPAIPLQNQLMIFLWYMGSLEPLCRIGDRFNVTEFSVIKIRRRLCNMLLRHFKTKYIKWPHGQDRQTVINAFREKKEFPDVIGAIDSTHIQLKPPKQHSQTYVNRKGYHSIILQCVCREDLRFTHCFAGWPGSCHDSRVLRNTDLYQNAINFCQDAHLIGDGGFPVKEWLMTPYRDNGHLTDRQKHYNYCLSSTRQVVERSFGLLKGRFRRLQNIDICDVEEVVKVCISGCTLHNICILEADELDDYFNDNQGQVQNIYAGLLDNDAAGVVKRDRICNTLP
jgi:hypothetical protein